MIRTCQPACMRCCRLSPRCAPRRRFWRTPTISTLLGGSGSTKTCMLTVSVWPWAPRRLWPIWTPRGPDRNTPSPHPKRRWRLGLRPAIGSWTWGRIWPSRRIWPLARGGLWRWRCRRSSRRIWRRCLIRPLPRRWPGWAQTRWRWRGRLAFLCWQPFAASRSGPVRGWGCCSAMGRGL